MKTFEIRITNTADDNDFETAEVQAEDGAEISNAVLELFKKRCMYCGESINGIINIHAHTEDGIDVTK